MGILFVCVAALSVGIANLCMRCSIAASGSSKGYLMIQLILSFIIVVMLYPVRSGMLTWNSTVAVVGLVGGIILGLLMLALGKSLEKGPSGVTFAVLYSAPVLAIIVLFLAFGPDLGHEYETQHILGTIMVVIGLVWVLIGAKHYLGTSWAGFLALMFSMSIIFFAFLKWHDLLLKPELSYSVLIPFSFTVRESQWFIPIVFLVAAAIHTSIYMVRVKQTPSGHEFLYGILGGVLYGLAAILILEGLRGAEMWERALAFPLFLTGIIAVCNIWGRWMYKEQVNWRAILLCSIGVLICMTDWDFIVM